MNGSRNYDRQADGRGPSLEALNRTIEGLEARLEQMMGQSGRKTSEPTHRDSPRAPGRQPATAAHPARLPGLGNTDPLAAIRARQDQIAGRRTETPPRAARTTDARSLYRGDTSSHLSPGAGSSSSPTTTRDSGEGLRDLAGSIAAMRQELKAEIRDSLTRELGAIRHEVRDLTLQSRELGLPDSLNRELASIAERVESLGQSGGNIDKLRLDLDSLRLMIDGLAREDSIRDLHNRWESVESRVADIDIAGVRDDLVKLAHRVDDIRDVVSNLPASPASNELESGIETISAAIEELARRSEMPPGQFVEYFQAIGERLDEIAGAVVTLQDQGGRSTDAAPFDRLETRIASIAERLDAMHGDHAGGEMGARLEAVAARLDRISDEDAVGRLDRRLADLQSLVERGYGEAANNAALPELTHHIATIAERLEHVGNNEIGEHLAHRLDDLAIRIDALQDQAEQHRNVPDAVIGRLEALIGRVEERTISDPLPGMQSLDARLAEISARLNEAAAPAANTVEPALQQVEARLDDIAARLDRPAASGDTALVGALEAHLAEISAKLDRAGTATGVEGDEALRSLEDQIANLSRQISATPSADGYARIDSRLEGIEESLATNDEYIIEAARQAADAALSAYAGTARPGQGGPGTPGIDNLEIITALADDLKALETVARQSDDRNLRAFEGVQETLYKIADRLERLQSVPAGRLPESEDVAAARMPRADALASDKDHEVAHADASAHENEGPLDDNAPARSPAEAAAMAADFASSDTRSQQSDDADEAATEDGGKSFLAGLTSRIRAKKRDDASPANEPRFTEEQTPPLEPDLELDEAIANVPLEPGSGAPDINRILQRVRESQAEGGRGDARSATSAEFLASARRAAQAAAAEAETLSGGRGSKQSGTGLTGAIKQRRKPILMAVGAVLLAVMSMPLLADLLTSEDGPQQAAKTSPVVEQAAQAPQDTSDAPASSEPAASPDAAAPSLAASSPAVTVPPVRVVEPEDPAEIATDQGAPASRAEVSNMQTAALTAPTEAVADEPAAVLTEATGESEDRAALIADLDALPQDMVPGSLRQAAEDLDPIAFYEIGARFTEGRGSEIDLSRAASWYQRAADLGHAPSQYRLANFFEKGSGLKRDVSAAKKWYQLAAEQGNASAMHNLAVLYATAGAAPDFESAARWFERAAALGVRDSQVNLAILYARGDGVARDLESSYKWFAVAAAEGDSDAAAKRDEVFNALQPDQAEAARQLVADFEAGELDRAANIVDIPPEWQGTETRTASVDMTKAIRNIQAILNNNGYDAGKPDGIMGAKTVAAIKAFQKAEGLEPNGKVTDALVRKLLERNG
ncbi:peptidoglycan-binding protein [Pseudohoeflea coraliihabitans]|uniref:SEL1-like repeat protein n=1 Tax=Pseudohoeflea coraliihabitans TaxID=2860393 RepID=A0ABS6WNB8_9HYPH|nr:peptidoglycan-binding protein [Pseudohoeflea sp. DP4N28-3]MBW3097459.1 SEL1-like repeat protein [Pseudohoeflea sp. DP4N28-3]